MRPVFKLLAVCAAVLLLFVWCAWPQLVPVATEVDGPAVVQAAQAGLAPGAAPMVAQRRSQILNPKPSAQARGVRALSLPVENIRQYPELPNGCEITSLTIVLNYLGFDVDKLTMADEYLPKTEVWGGNPETAYMGNPRDNGWYCYPGPLAQAADDYLTAQGSALRGEDISGASEAELEEQLRLGRPVVVWISIGFAQPRRSQTMGWQLNGQRFVPYTNLHVAVLTGYTPDSFLLAEPITGLPEISRDTFMEIYTAMGSRALVVA